MPLLFDSDLAVIGLRGTDWSGTAYLRALADPPGDCRRLPDAESTGRRAASPGRSIVFDTASLHGPLAVFSEVVVFHSGHVFIFCGFCGKSGIVVCAWIELKSTFLLSIYLSIAMHVCF